MSSPFDKRLSGIINNSLTAVLKPLGFRKRGSIYECRFDEISWLVDVQRSRWNTAEKAEFTLNCGVYVPGVVSTYVRNHPEPKAPSLVDCCIHARIGVLAKDKQDVWWELRADDDAANVDERTAAEIRERMKRDVLPFLERFKNRQDVVAYLKTSRPPDERRVWPMDAVIGLAYLGILYSLLGQHDECASVLVRAEKGAIRSPLEEHIKWLRAHLS